MNSTIGYIVVGWDLTCEVSFDLPDVHLHDVAKQLDRLAVGLLTTNSVNAALRPLVVGKCIGTVFVDRGYTLLRDGGKIVNPLTDDRVDAQQAGVAFYEFLPKHLSDVKNVEMSGGELARIQRVLGLAVQEPISVFIIWGKQ